jgi:hypothetical protein
MYTYLGNFQDLNMFLLCALFLHQYFIFVILLHILLNPFNLLKHNNRKSSHSTELTSKVAWY